MTRPSVFIFWIVLAGLAAAAPRFAVVRVSEIYQEFDATKAADAAIKEQRAAVDRDPRLDAYRSVLKELEDLNKKLESTTDAELREQFQRTHALKNQEALTLYREFSEFRQKRLREIDARMVADMQDRLATIHKLTARIAEEQGFDGVFDASGNSNTGLPVMIYAKQPHDMTSDVLAALTRMTSAKPSETASGNLEN